MNVDVYWLLNVIASALLAGASVKLFVHLAERVHFVEIPPKRLSGMGFCLVMLSTFIGGWYHVGYAALVVAAIVTAWCAISWANKWVESPHFARFAEQMNSNPAPATGSLPPAKAGRRWFTILAPTLLEALRCPACGRQAMSPSVKANIGPAKTHPCDSCGVHVSPSWAFVVGLSAVAGAGFISAVSRPDYAISLLIATAVIVFTLIFRYSQRVPLVRRNPQAS